MTVGPSSLKVETLQKLNRAGANNFRINLSHSTKESLKVYFDIFSKAKIKPSIDTQGAQIRVESLPGGSNFNEGEEVLICFGKNKSNENLEKNSKKEKMIIMNHPEVINQISKGDLLKVDFEGLSIEMITLTETKDSWIGRVVTSGKVIVNRAVDIHGKSVQLSALTEFDKYAIEEAMMNGCKEVYASFVNRADDIRYIRRVIDDNIKLISKIESAEAVGNADEIVRLSDAILIDRGDLSREISIPAIPIAVKSIIQIAKKYEKEVYIATNILDSMMTNSLPSRAEISDIYTLLDAGVDGLVLAAEVAIGKHPVESTALVEYLMRLYENHKQGLHGISYIKKPDRNLIGEKLYHWI